MPRRALITGDLATFQCWLDAMEHFAVELGQPALRWAVGFHRSNQARNAGDLCAVEASAQEALEIGTAAGVLTPSGPMARTCSGSATTRDDLESSSV